MGKNKLYYPALGTHHAGRNSKVNLPEFEYVTLLFIQGRKDKAYGVRGRYRRRPHYVRSVTVQMNQDPRGNVLTAERSTAVPVIQFSVQIYIKISASQIRGQKQLCCEPCETSKKYSRHTRLSCRRDWRITCVRHYPWIVGKSKQPGVTSLVKPPTRCLSSMRHRSRRRRRHVSH